MPWIQAGIRTSAIQFAKWQQSKTTATNQQQRARGLSEAQRGLERFCLTESAPEPKCSLASQHLEPSSHWPTLCNFPKQTIWRLCSLYGAHVWLTRCYRVREWTRSSLKLLCCPSDTTATMRRVWGETDHMFPLCDGRFWWSGTIWSSWKHFSLWRLCSQDWIQSVQTMRSGSALICTCLPLISGSLTEPSSEGRLRTGQLRDRVDDTNTSFY